MFDNTDNTAPQEFTGFLDENMSDVDFFAEEESSSESPTNILEDDLPLVQENTSTQKTEEDKDKKPEVKKEADLFEVEEDDTVNPLENSSENNPSENKGGEDKIANSKLINSLKNRGLIEFELEEGEELTEERAEEILEDSFENMFEDRLEELFSGVPKVVKDLNKFVINGGDPNTFLQQVANNNTASIKRGMDLQDKNNAKAVISEGLAAQGYDQDYIDSQIEFLESKDLLERDAKVHYDKWEKEKDAKEEAILQSEAAAKNKEKIQRRALKNKVVDFLSETKEIEGYKISKEDRKVLPNYMSDRTVQLENGAYVTGLQKDLMRVLNSPTGSIQMAKLLRAATEQGELNFEDIGRNVRTNVTQEVRENVQNRSTIVTKNADGNKKRPLHSYFN